MDFENKRTDNRETTGVRTPSGPKSQPSPRKQQMPGVFQGETNLTGHELNPGRTAPGREFFANRRDWPWADIVLGTITAAIVLGIIRNFRVVTTAIFNVIVSLVSNLVALIVVVIILVILWNWLIRGPRRRW